MSSFRRILVLWPLVTSLLAAATAGDAPAREKAWAFVGAKVYPSPSAEPIRHGVVVVRGDRIAAVGTVDQGWPEDAERIDCRGRILVAGYWNAHVHFIEPKWDDAAGQPPERLEAQLRQMLTRHGFTTVVDVGSLVTNTVALRQRIESGEVAGPRILTAGLPLYPAKGVPFYITESLPEELVRQLPAPATPAEAAQLVARNFDAGADLLKLFLVTGVREQGIIVLKSMAPEIVAAAVAEAHQRDRLVFAHPSTLHGVELALAGGVDGLAHSIEDPQNWNAPLIARLRAADMTFVPTLTLFRQARDFPAILYQVKSYSDAGGRILYGTDVGYLTDYAAVEREIDWLGQAGLSFQQILATLTTNPAAEFGRSGESGEIVVGAEADLVLLGADPADDVGALGHVLQTWRKGRLLYDALPTGPSLEPGG